jgi:hypothetical protein
MPSSRRPYSQGSTGVRCRIAPEVAPPEIFCGGVARQPAGTPPAAQDPQRFPIEVFRQIEDRGPDPLMDRVPFAVRRVAQGNDQDIQAALFEGEDFLCNEGFRKARIALEDKSDWNWHAGHRTGKGAGQPRSSTTLSADEAAGRSQGWTRRSTLSRPSSKPGMTTSDGSGWRGRLRRALAITAGS